MFKKLILSALLLFTVLLAWGSWVGAENTSDETVRISATDTTSGNLMKDRESILKTWSLE